MLMHHAPDGLLQAFLNHSSKRIGRFAASAAGEQGPEDDVVTEPALTQLKLKLTFYDKTSVPAKQGKRRILDSEEGFPPEA